MRYFDSEDNKGLKLSPKIVVGAAIVFTILPAVSAVMTAAVLILCLPVFWPMS